MYAYEITHVNCCSSASRSHFSRALRAVRILWRYGCHVVSIPVFRRNTSIASTIHAEWSRSSVLDSAESRPWKRRIICKWSIRWEMQWQFWRQISPARLPMLTKTLPERRPKDAYFPSWLLCCPQLPTQQCWYRRYADAFYILRVFAIIVELRTGSLASIML